MAEKLPSRLPLIILAITLMIVFFRLLLGEVFFWGLPALQFYPWREYAFDLLRAGQFPLWNPYNGAGAPLIANYQSALFYPPNWPGFFLPLAWAMSVTAVAHLFMAGWGMWSLTGRLGLPAFGRGVSALAFGLTAYLVARLGTYPTISAAAWLPWLLWAAQGLLAQGRRRHVAWFGLFAALALLAGHAQTAWYSLLLTAVFALWWAFFAPEMRRLHNRQRVARFGLLAGAILLGASVAAIQLLPTAELLAQSQRSNGVDVEFAMNFSYSPLRALNFLAPNVFGNPGDGSYLTQGAFFEDAVYIGLIPLLAAFASIFGWLARRRQPDTPFYFRTVPFWWLIVLVGFAFALGKYSPIFPFLYERVPTFDLFQGPVRWHLWTVLALSLLAGIGTQSWGKGKWRIFWTRLATAGCIGAVLLALFIAPALLPENVRTEAGVTVLIGAFVTTGIGGAAAGALTLLQPETGTKWEKWRAVWQSAVLLVIAVDLGWAAWGLNPTVPASFYDRSPQGRDPARLYWPEETADFVQYEIYLPFDDYRSASQNWQDFRASHLANLNLLDRAPLLNNFEPLLVGTFAQYSALIEANAPQRATLLSAAGTIGIYDDDGHPRVLNTTARRAWHTASACWHAAEDALTAALLAAEWQPQQQVHLLGDGGCAAPHNNAQSAAVIRADSGSMVEIEVTAARDGWLVLADSYYPGWTAYVDDAESYIYRANLNFRAVQVSAGTHQVRFEYRPAWLMPAALSSVFALLILFVLFRTTGEVSRD
ncbi:MAG: YfhO family protein [Chloroflexi bacterium]|nr:YfhO family protein [Chloroflexota bacterium]